VNGSARTRFSRIKLAKSVLPARQRRHNRRHVVGCNRVLLHQTGLGPVLIGEQIWKTDSLEAFGGVEDLFVAGRHVDPVEALAHRHPFAHVLDHRHTKDWSQWLTREPGRAHAGGNNGDDLLGF